MHYRWSRIRCSSPRLRSSLGADHCSWHRSYLARRLGDSNIFVCTTVIKEPAIFLWNHTFDKDDVWNLANFFPVFFRGEDGSVRAVENFAGIVAVEDADGSTVDEIVVGGAEPVHPILAVDFLGHDRAGLRPTSVPVSFVGGKDHAFAFPMNEVE